MFIIEARLLHYRLQEDIIVGFSCNTGIFQTSGRYIYIGHHNSITVTGKNHINQSLPPNRARKGDKTSQRTKTWMTQKECWKTSSGKFSDDNGHDPPS